MPHIHEKIDFTVGVYLVYKNTVLLRMHDKIHTWLDVGGHIELDEDPNEAAIREVKEEAGLDISLVGKANNFSDTDGRDLIAPKFLHRHTVANGHEHISLIYFAKAPSDKLAPAEGEQQDGMKWFTREELDDPKYEIRDNVKHYAKAALKELGSL